MVELHALDTKPLADFAENPSLSADVRKIAVTILVERGAWQAESPTLVPIAHEVRADKAAAEKAAAEAHEQK